MPTVPNQTRPVVYFIAAYLGGPRTTLRISTSRANDQLGVQAYFTSEDGIYENNELRYNIYTLTYNKSNSSYNLKKIIDLANPNTIDTTVGGNALSTCYYGGNVSSNGKSYTCEYYMDDRDTSYYKTNYPITIQTQELNDRPTVENTGQSGNEVLYTITAGKLYNPTDLVQAYLIEARYSDPNNLCSAFVTVYGNKDTIASVEGLGTYMRTVPPYLSSNATSTGGWLLTGWDYSNDLKPVPDYPSIPTSGLGVKLGPWVFVKIRRFSTTPNSI